MNDAVTKYVQSALAEGQLVAGDQLPTERSLAENLNLPRSAVRRSLAELERQGQIIRHVGRGTFLADEPSHGSYEGLMTSPAEIMDTRLVLEPEVAARAAQSATQTDLERIEMCMRRGNASEPYDEFESWDSAFHRAIASSVHNELLLHVFDTMNAARNLPLWGSSKRRSATLERRRVYEAQHDAIFMALADRDAPGAREAMIAHLESVRSNLLNPPR